MIKLFYHKEYYTNWCSELVILYDDLRNYVDDSRFKNVDKNHFIYVNKIEDCDFVVLPFKWRGLDEITRIILNDCISNGKKVLIFYNDDNDGNIPINENLGLIFRTSFYKSNKKVNEFALPPFFSDDFSNNYIPIKDIKLSVGFCGFNHFQRQEALNYMRSKNEIETDFIIRKGFWGGGLDKETAILEFNKNLEKNLFGFTSRGAGNFSYRFYQILSMGRIPIFLNTDSVLPFEDNIDYTKHSLIVDVSEINILGEKIINYYKEKNLEELYEIQKNNRKLYEDYLSPNGFLKNIKNILIKYGECVV